MSDFTGKLIHKASSGDQDAITELYELTYSSVYKTVKSMIADEDTVLDIVQDSFIKGFQSLKQLDTPENFRAWMKRIATNKAKDYLKKKKPILFTDMENEYGEEIDFQDDCLEHCPEEVLDRKETARLMNEILATLSEEQRLVIGMFYYEEMSVREISEILGCSENTVKSRLNYGRKKVEVKVKELEKRGTKLYSLAPLPFLLWLFRMDAEAAEIPSGMVLEAVTAECAAAGAAGGAAGAAAAAGTGAKTIAGAGVKALAAKIIAGVLAVSVVGGGTRLALSFNNREGAESTQPEQVATENTEDTMESQSVSEISFDSILIDIQTALTISAQDYDSNMEYYDSLYGHLGEGVMWMLTHRESGVYTLGIWNIYRDIDGDGQEELCIGRGASPSRVTPIVIYKRSGEVIYGDDLYDYTDLFEGLSPLEINFLGQ